MGVQMTIQLSGQAMQQAERAAKSLGQSVEDFLSGYIEFYFAESRSGSELDEELQALLNSYVITHQNSGGRAVLFR